METKKVQAPPGAAESGVEEGGKNKENGEVITDAATLLILKKFEEASKERTAISSSVEEKINELKNGSGKED